MHVIQDYWSFGSMQEFLGWVRLLQLNVLLPSHSIQLIHLLSVFKEQMQNMLLISIFDMFELFYLIVWNCCFVDHIFTCTCYLQGSIGNATKEIQEVRAMLECFNCMIGTTAGAWSYCISRSDGDMLLVWFRYPFMHSEHDIKIIAVLGISTKDKQHAILCFLVSQVMKSLEIFWQLAVKYGQDCLSQWHVHKLIKMFRSSWTSVAGVDRLRMPIHICNQTKQGVCLSTDSW